MNDQVNQDIEKELIAITHQLLMESGEVYQRDIKIDDSLQQHLGIDSLSRAELFQRVEKKMGMSLPDRLLVEAETLNDIARYLREAHPHSNTKTLRTPASLVHQEWPRIDLTAAKTLLDVVFLYGEKVPGKPHIYFQNEEGHEEIITYGDLMTSSLRVAHSLRERGLKEGETVAIMQPTQLGFFYTFMGTLMAGGIPVPIYPPFRAHMLEAYAKTEAKILRSAEVRFLVTFDQAEKLSHLLRAFVPSLSVVTTVEALLQPDQLKSPYAAKSNDFAFIQYTSGSTSDPKGVLLTHHNLLSNIRAYGQAIQIVPDDVAVSWLPLYHDLGLIAMWLGSLFYGAPLILMTPFSFLNRPERWLWNIHYHRGTLSGAPNFAYELCVRKIDAASLEGLDLSSWRLAANGAEKVYPRTLEQFAQKFAPYGFKRNALMPVYGLAESTVGLAVPPPGREFRVDHVDRKPFEEKQKAISSEGKNTLSFVSCGPPLPGHDIRVVNEQNTVLPERHVGHLQFRGPSSMQGYYNNPRATEAVHHDGWFDTGDLAYLVDGELFVTGRRKDLIIKAGRNLYPAEIEELIGTVPGVRQGCVAAFGVTDAERGTEQLVVIAETREKDKVKRGYISDSIKSVIADALDMVPDHVVLVPPRTVPKTSSGKLQRAACKKKYLDGDVGKRHIPVWLQITKLGLAWLGQKILDGLRTLWKAIYSVYLALLLLVTLPFLYVIVRWSSSEVSITACRIWAHLLRSVAFCPLTILGRPYLTQTSPMIFAANHASYIDALILFSLVPKETRFIGKAELFSTPIIRTFVRKLGCLAVDRKNLSQGLADTKQIEALLKSGHSVLIFPEGTFGYAMGLRPFRSGAFKLAVETGMTVCPIALRGTRSVLRDSELFAKPARLTVTVCEPIKPAGVEWQHVTQLRHAVRAAIAKYCGEPSLDFIVAQTVAPKPHA